DAPPHHVRATRDITRPIVFDDLPAVCAEVDLGAPPDVLERIDDDGVARTVFVLVRLHTHPLGTVILDCTGDLRWLTHASTVWSSIRDAANTHLVADGLPAVGDWTELAGPLTSTPRCVARRRTVLANPPRITVVVATRDRPRLLHTCLDALLDLTYPDYEIVVVDSAPDTSATATLVSNGYYQYVRYIRENSEGLAAARNRGLREATGSIIAFVDDDVTVDRHWLAAIAEGFHASAAVGCVTGLVLPTELVTAAQLLRHHHDSADRPFSQMVVGTSRHRTGAALSISTARRLGSGANMAFDTAVLRALGGFDPGTGIGTPARGGDDLAAFARVLLDHEVVHQPSAVAVRRHDRDVARLLDQAHDYGVGLGVAMTSVLLREPRIWAACLRRCPAALVRAVRPSSGRNRSGCAGLPVDLTRIERRGLLAGPVFYLVSRWRGARRPAAVTTATPRAQARWRR
ncbi:MAG: glycosyltransferase family 2 protein, partial [Mycobacterium sp.]